MHFVLVLFLVLFSCCSLQAKEKQPRICLNMIVKNESAVIRRCLDSIKPLIDYWVIVDTGSTDGTQEIIKEHLKDIPGELYERPWINFGYNRSEAYDLVKGKGEYILFMDADDWLEYTSPECFASLTKDAYMMWRGTKEFSYLKPQLVKGDLSWKWIGVTHEYLNLDRPYGSEILAGVNYVSGDNGASSHDPQKFWKNVVLLEQGLKDEPDNARYAFYLAESYRDAGELQKAIECYEKRVAMGGWEEEVYWSLLQIAKLQKYLDMPLDTVIESFNRAHRYRPSRVEPVYHLAEIYNQLGKYDLAYETLSGRLFTPKNPHKDVLFNEEWMDHWGMMFQMSIASYYVGQHQQSLNLCDYLIKADNVPEHIREQVKRNREFPAQKLIAQMDSLYPEVIPAENESTSIKENAIATKKEKISKKNGVKAPGKSVLISICAKDQAHVLPVFLNCIQNLDYDKKLITLDISSCKSSDQTEELLKKWVARHRSHYKEVFFNQEANEAPIAQLKNAAMKKTVDCHCDYYFSVDCGNFIAPYTLKHLIASEKPLIAPMLRAVPFPKDAYSNFVCEVDHNGYGVAHPSYFTILNLHTKGAFPVPLVHSTYLVQAKVIDQLTYCDDTNDEERIVFGRSARNNHIQQFICNEKDFGVALNYAHEQLKDLTLDQKKQYFQNFLMVQRSVGNSGLFSFLNEQKSVAAPAI